MEKGTLEQLLAPLLRKYLLLLSASVPFLCDVYDIPNTLLSAASLDVWADVPYLTKIKSNHIN